MSPIRPDLPSPRHAATQPVTTTSARVAQAAFFQQALAGVKSAQETARAENAEAASPASTPASGPESGDRLTRPGSILDMRV